MALSVLFWLALSAGIKVVDEILDDSNKNPDSLEETINTIQNAEVVAHKNQNELKLDMTKYKFHITSFDNLDSIIQNGLLSPNEIEKKQIQHKSSADVFASTQIFKQNLYSSEYINYSNNYVRFGGLKTPTFENWFKKNQVIHEWNYHKYMGFIVSGISQHKNYDNYKDELYWEQCISIKNSSIKGCLLFSNCQNIYDISREEILRCKEIAKKVGIDTYVCSVTKFTESFKNMGSDIELEIIKI